MQQLSTNLPWDLANTKWAATLNPLLANPLASGQLLAGVVLKSGDNQVAHGLQRAPQGYIVVKNSAAVTFYDKVSQTPALFLTINASGATTVSLYVF